MLHTEYLFWGVNMKYLDHRPAHTRREKHWGEAATMINSSHAQHTALQIPVCLCEVLNGREAS